MEIWSSRAMGYIHMYMNGTFRVEISLGSFGTVRIFFILKISKATLRVLPT